MDFLFPDVIIPELLTFIQPTIKESNDWIKQTGGIWTNEILKWLGKPIREDRTNIVYNGTLTIAQQWFILCELMDDSKLQEDKL